MVADLRFDSHIFFVGVRHIDVLHQGASGERLTGVENILIMIKNYYDKIFEISNIIFPK